jgi:hypothetical protein
LTACFWPEFCIDFLIQKFKSMANRKNTTRPMKAEDKEERNQHRPQSRKTEKMPVKGDDPDKKLEKGKTPESKKRAT